MIDIFTIKKGDLVEYGPYLCSESLKGERFYGVYQDYMLWSPDERPVEMWVILIGQSPHTQGNAIFTRASQVTHVYPASEVQA